MAAVAPDSRMNFASREGVAALSHGFLPFLEKLSKEFTPRACGLVAMRAERLAAAHAGKLPTHLPPSKATTSDWRIELPAWCADQRNQMTGPADDAELCVKMLNSGAPGVMLDLEDSTANTFDSITVGIRNIREALRGALTYFDKKRNQNVSIKPSNTVIWLRPRGLHLSQAGVLSEPIPAPLFDCALIAFSADPAEMKHPLSFYIPKSESAEEANWWADLFYELASAKDLPKDYIKCMALVESHPLAFEMEEFAYNLRKHILGLNLGRWDYMASLIHFNLHDPAWVLPDRNTIPHNVAFFQNLRELIPEICHKRGMLAIGGMTALYPSREDAELNARALAVLENDKKNEALSLMDGAWTGHPDQNEIAVRQFPAPNQLHARPENPVRYPDLRPRPEGVGTRSLAGTHAAVRTVIRYRNGVLNGKGASLLDGYMEDLATDRIYRLMLAQRMKHSGAVEITDADGHAVEHTPELLHRLFETELVRIQEEFETGKLKDAGTAETFLKARMQSEQMILRGEITPV